MHNISIEKITKRLPCISSAALFAAALVLAMAATGAESSAGGKRPSKSAQSSTTVEGLNKRGACKDWLPDPDDKKNVKGVFMKALKKSAENTNQGKRLRRRLLDNNSAKGTIQAMLDNDFPHN